MSFSIKNSNKKIYISVTISDDVDIKKLNKQYKDRDYATDVLSFPMHEETDDGAYYLGDIVINKEQAQRQADEYGNNLEEEIAALVEHGVLHLLGIHHEGDE